MGYGGYGNVGGCCCEGGDIEPVSCSACNSEEGPFCWKVTISGMNNDGGAAGNANNVNGVHYLTWWGGHQTAECSWRCRHILVTVSNEMADLQLVFESNGMGGFNIRLSLRGELFNLGDGGPVFEKSVDGDIDCSVSHSLDWSSGGDGSMATCTIEPAECACNYPHTPSDTCFCSKCGLCKQGTDDNIIGFRVVIDGLQDDSGCPGSDLNGTYDFDWPWDNENNEPADPSSSGTSGQDGQTILGCWGRSTFTSIGCTCGNDLEVRFRLITPGASPTNGFRAPAVALSILRGPFYAVGWKWEKTLGSIGELLDCRLSSEVMDNSHYSVVGTGCPIFDASSATITVTALTA